MHPHHISQSQRVNRTARNDVRLQLSLQLADQVHVVFNRVRPAHCPLVVKHKHWNRMHSLALDLVIPVSYTHLRAHETPEHLVCRLLLEKKKKKKKKIQQMKIIKIKK
eukprot:TRINITY_DN18049_c0_g1_i2.p1 TRINITY_DN18049_c0_g1~~TRINITY_DN18049_c0_g1_i2.p1  ORF type:complete len:108 (-),score=17.34 TRINITY_DN18049_c0_g1_i2:47-370(-)